MNVTESRFKNRQLHIEDYLQMVSAEQREYVEVFDYGKITEKSGIITDYWTENLLKLILRKDNLNKAYKKVKSNKGSGGIDRMQVDELLLYLRENQETLIQEIKEGKYKPNPVRRVEIPKETKGEFRKLGVPTVVDRVIQQAITQELTPIYEEQFSENSFGFRPKRGAKYEACADTEPEYLTRRLLAIFEQQSLQDAFSIGLFEGTAKQVVIDADGQRKTDWKGVTAMQTQTLTPLQKRVDVIPANVLLTKSNARKRKLRVAAYCRVSTEQEEQQSSYAAQIAYYTEKINKNKDWELAGIFADEGITGTSAKKRTEFLKLMALCEKGKDDMMLTKSVSQFSRNAQDVIGYIRKLEAKGIPIIF